MSAVSPEKVRRMHREYWEYEHTLRTVAHRYDISHEYLRKLFIRESLPVRTRKESWELRQKNAL